MSGLSNAKFCKLLVKQGENVWRILNIVYLLLSHTGTWLISIVVCLCLPYLWILRVFVSVPIKSIDGKDSFAEVFFDNVIVPTVQGWVLLMRAGMPLFEYCQSSVQRTVCTGPGVLNVNCAN